MSFIDSYKHLEKLCGKILNDDRRISAYIDEMRDTPRGSYYVETWDEDFKKLRHYRHIRNRISHEPGCTEENMCKPEDELWINNFFSRIINQTDPLSLYHQATNHSPVSGAASKPVQNKSKHAEQNRYRKLLRSFACVIIAVSLFVAVIVFLMQFI